MFIAIAVFMGDGIYNLLKTIYLSVEVRIWSGHSLSYTCSKSLNHCANCMHLHPVICVTLLLSGFVVRMYTSTFGVGEPMCSCRHVQACRERRRTSRSLTKSAPQPKPATIAGLVARSNAPEFPS